MIDSATVQVLLYYAIFPNVLMRNPIQMLILVLVQFEASTQGEQEDVRGKTNTTSAHIAGIVIAALVVL